MKTTFLALSIALAGATTAVAAPVNFAADFSLVLDLEQTGTNPILLGDTVAFSMAIDDDAVFNLGNFLSDAGITLAEFNAAPFNGNLDDTFDQAFGTAVFSRGGTEIGTVQSPSSLIYVANDIDLSLSAIPPADLVALFGGPVPPIVDALGIVFETEIPGVASQTAILTALGPGNWLETAGDIGIRDAADKVLLLEVSEEVYGGTGPYRSFTYGGILTSPATITPVPVPAPGAMLLLGAVVLGRFGRKTRALVGQGDGARPEQA